MAPRRPPVALLPCLVSCECVVCMTLGLCGEEPRCRSLPFFQSSAPAVLTGPHNYVWRAARAAAVGSIQISAKATIPSKNKCSSSRSRAIRRADISSEGRRALSLVCLAHASPVLRVRLVAFTSPLTHIRRREPVEKFIPRCVDRSPPSQDHRTPPNKLC